MKTIPTLQCATDKSVF